MTRNVDVLIYLPRAILPTPAVITIPASPSLTDLRAAIIPLLPGAVEMERVTVLFRGERTDMFVDESGAQYVGDRPPLPVNEAATLIYHEASRRRGERLTDASRIHGPAVVTLERVWY